MAKKEMLQRLLLIICKLDGKSKYVQSDDLLGYIELNMRYRHGYTAGYSLRTVQRDIKSIEELFGIIIKHRKDFGYYISEREQVSWDKYEQMLLNFDILTALKAESGLKDCVLAEHHRPVGGSHMPLLMDAIRHSYYVAFDYTLLRQDNKVVHKKVAPHFLKESQQRWYLLALDEGKWKTFGVERMSNISLMEHEHFERDGSVDIDNLFKDSFGIWNQEDIPVEEVLLSYDALDGSFLKSVPLHHSQTVLEDTAEAFRVRLRLRITNDFVMELLSRSRSLTVIEPLSLRERLREVYKEALQRNS